MLRVDFAAAGNAKWVLSAAKECEASGRGCTTSAVATGTVPWALGEWRTLRLAAKRQAKEARKAKAHAKLVSEEQAHAAQASVQNNAFNAITPPVSVYPDTPYDSPA